MKLKIMQVRFDKYIKEFQGRIDGVKGKKVNSTVFFGTEELGKKIQTLNDYLASLKNYAQKIAALISKQPENKEFYDAHFEAVVKMLEKIDTKKPRDLNNEDFEIIVPKSIQFYKTKKEKDVELGKITGIGAGIGALLGLVVLIGLTLGLAFHLLVPLFTTGVGLLIVAGVALAFAAVGAAIGAALGFLFGYFALPTIEKLIKRSLFNMNNPYLDNTALDINLLKNAYQVLSEEAGNYYLKNSNEESSESVEDDTAIPLKTYEVF